MLTLAANTPDDKSSIDNLYCQFCDLHPYADIAAKEHQFKEVFAAILQVKLLYEILQQCSWPFHCAVGHMTLRKHENIAQSVNYGH
jgi:hypothetical protein